MDVEAIRHVIENRHIGRQRGHRGFTDPWRALAAGLLVDSVRVALFEPEPEAVAARAWLVGDPLGRFVCDSLDVQRADVLRVAALSTRR